MRAAQLPLRFGGRGGKRPGAGRKPKGVRAGVSHAARPSVSRHRPLHVTLRMTRGLPSLREQALLAALRGALRAGKERFGLRVVHYSIQRDHVHLVVEAADRRALTRGMQGLDVRVARAINGVLRKRGTVLGDRYHARALGSPREVRRVLLYVLLNWRKHARTRPSDIQWDLASSGVTFDGWSTGTPRDDVPDAMMTTISTTRAPPRCWLLRVGWRRRGLIDPRDVPLRGAGR